MAKAITLATARSETTESSSLILVLEVSISTPPSYSPKLMPSLFFHQIS